MSANRKVALVTGAAGFLGANLLRRLLESGFDCHALLRPSTPLWRLPGNCSALHLHPVELTEPGELESVISACKPSTVFHLAAAGGHAHDAATRIAAINTSILGTANLLESLRRHPPQQFIYTGSWFEHAPTALAQRESDPIEPFGFRGAVKACATLLCRDFANHSGISTVLLRPYTVYGYWEQPRRLVPRALHCALNDQPLALTEPGYQRDLVFVDDVVDALIAAMHVPNCPGEIYNVASGQASSNEQVVAAVESVTGRSIRREQESYPLRGIEVSNCRVDVSKAKSQLNWTAKTDLHSGLAQTARWLAAYSGNEYCV